MLASAFLLLLLLSAVTSLPLPTLRQPSSSTRLFVGEGDGGVPSFDQPVRYPLSSQQEVLQQQVDAEIQQQKAMSALPDPTFADMKRLAFILANITTQLETEPAGALSTASQEMGWLLSRNVPRLMQDLLQEYPVLRKDKGMMGGYMFVMDFLETVTAETSKVVSKQQSTLRELLEAAQGGEARLRAALSKLRQAGALSADFIVYLDSELASTAGGSGPSAEGLLTTLKLLVVEEMGAEQGDDAIAISKLASEEDPVRVREGARSYFARYDAGGKALLLQTLQLMRREMRSRYDTLDPMFVENMGIIEGVLDKMLDEDDAAAAAAAASSSGCSDNIISADIAPYDSLLVDASASLSTVVVSGRDKLRFLQGLCTASVEGASPGDLLSCAFLSAQARVLQYCRAVVSEEEVTLLCDASDARGLLQHLQKYLFPADQVQLRLETAPGRRVLLLLCKEEARQGLVTYFCGRLADSETATSGAPAAAAGRKWRQPRVLVARPRLLALEGSGFESVPGAAPEPAVLAAPLACGATFIVDDDDTAALAALSSSPSDAHGIVTDPSATKALLELVRLAVGKPCLSREQGASLNSSVLELGLVHSVHFTKGCYVGQEVVAKTTTTSAVRRRLCVLQTSSAPYGTAVGDRVLDSDGEEVGVVTSAAPPSVPLTGLGDARLRGLLDQMDSYASSRCLALVKTKLSSAGTRLHLLRKATGAITEALVEAAPYCRYSADDSAPAPPIALRASAAKKALAGEEGGMGAARSEEDRRREEKMRLMKETAEAAKKKRAS